MDTFSHDCRFVFARRLLTEPEIWRRTGEIAFALDQLKAITGDETESEEKRAYAEKMTRQLCVAAKPPSSIYASAVTTR